MPILVVSFAALMASGPATAAKQVSETCSGGGQLCNNIATFSINVSGAGGPRQGKFTPGPLTCSNVRLHVLLDGTEIAVTPFVGPGQTTGFISLGFIGPGTHTLGLQAEGEGGGCNVGNLVSWAGTVKMKLGP
jgi:hypothetical protein